MRVSSKSLATIAVLLAVAGVAFVMLWHRPPAAPGGSGQPAIALPQMAIGGPFQLIDQTGHPVSERSYPGKFLLVYFGYTTCPDVCPTQLQTIAAALKLLGSRADRLAPLFITVDPERDTVGVLAGYTRLFDPRIVGLTGNPADVAAAERAYRVYAQKRPGLGGAPYLMDHTSFVYLMGSDGHLRALFDATTQSAAMAATISNELSW